MIFLAHTTGWSLAEIFDMEIRDFQRWVSEAAAFEKVRHPEQEEA